MDGVEVGMKFETRVAMQKRYAAERAKRIYFSEGELATLMRALPTGPQDAIQTQWGSTDPRGLHLENPTHNQLILLAHMRGVEHVCEAVCARLAALPTPSGAP